MDGNMRQRLVMAGTGALAGISLYLLSEVLEQHLLPDRVALGATAFAAVFFGALLALTGPLGVLRSVLGAGGVGLGVAVLLVLTSLRYANVESAFDSPMAALAVLVLATVPLPFLIAGAGPGWRDYPVLFSAAWNVVVRYAAAWLFVGVVWALLFLSDALLSIVGIDIIEQVIETAAAPWVITGVVLGLALAVVAELSDLVSPYLILRLLRLLLPLVLVVMALFILALPVQGLSGLLGGLSAAGTLLGMVVAAATLVTTAVDQTDAEAVQGRVMLRATQALALILPVPAALAGYAVWLRVEQYGWTPDRLFGAMAAGMGLAYGLLYALSVLRGRAWMQRIRQGNVLMALVLLVVAALWLSPVLDAERISSRDQLARFETGRTPLEALDLYAMGRWGLEGRAALDALGEQAKQPGQEPLAQRLAGATVPENGLSEDEVLAELAALMPVQPAGAAAERDRMLALTDSWTRQFWLDQCRRLLDDGRAGCVMVIADFWPETPGDEALLALNGTGGVFYAALAGQNAEIQRSVGSVLGLPDDLGVLRRLQDEPPRLAPVPLNQIETGAGPLFIVP